MKILIIEDDLALANNIKLSFKKLNIQNDHVVSAEEAFDFLGIYTYDLILLDIMLPDSSGFDILKELREDGILTPVLILSGLNNHDDKLEGFKQGADDYITKPFDKDELLARVHAIVRRSKGHAQSIVKIGKLEINLDSKQVLAANKRIPLTNKEYSILEILSLKRGKTVSKEHLLDQLYGGNEEPEPKIIDVFVCKLRKKITDLTGDNYIGTIWGQGYILNEPSK
jgi:two-component system cell cycle response regulator CtrA